MVQDGAVRVSRSIAVGWSIVLFVIYCVLRTQFPPKLRESFFVIIVIILVVAVSESFDFSLFLHLFRQRLISIQY